MLLRLFDIFANLGQGRSVGTGNSSAQAVFKELAGGVGIQAEIGLRLGCLQLAAFIFREYDAESLKAKALSVVGQLVESFENGCLRNNNPLPKDVP